MSICIVELPLNLGLRVTSIESELGVKILPEWFRLHDFHKQINTGDIQSLSPPSYRLELDEESGVLNADGIVDYAKEQVNLISRIFSEK